MPIKPGVPTPLSTQIPKRAKRQRFIPTIAAINIQLDKSSYASRQLAFAQCLKRWQPTPSAVLMRAAVHVRVATDLLSNHSVLSALGAFPRAISADSDDAGLFLFRVGDNSLNIATRLTNLSNELQGLKNEMGDLTRLLQQFSVAAKDAEAAVAEAKDI